MDQRYLKYIVVIPVVFFSYFFSCKSNPDNNTDKNKKNEESALSLYNIEDPNAKFITLPSELKEISGISFTNDDRLFAEEDEYGNVFQLDVNTGKIIKNFSLGDTAIKGDFEDISIAGDRFFLLKSKGKLYEFKEGADQSSVKYRSYPTFLTRDNNAEGLCYDPETNTLLIACKDFPGEKYDKMRAVYSFSLASMTLDSVPRFLIPVRSVKKGSVENEFHPSGIARHPLTGSFFIIAAKGNIIVEISKEGVVVNQKELPENVHIQPEGIAFSKDNTLYISNEGKGKDAAIVVYPMLISK